jgi:hypothetical protein
MSADDDDRTIDPAFQAPVDLKERCRRAIAFLQRARDLPELSSTQIDRIEQRLHQQPPRPVRRPLLSPALAALFVLLLAGGALAMAGRDLTWLPGIGRWLGARHPQPSAPAPRAVVRTPRAETPGGWPAPPPAATTPELPPPTPVIARPARVEGTRERAHEARGYGDLASRKAGPLPVHPAEFASRKAGPLPNPPPRRTAGEGTGSSTSGGVAGGEVTTPPRVEPAPESSAFPPAARAAGTTAALSVAPSIPAAQPASSSSPPAPVVAASPIVAESRSFASALERWHRDHDAAAALVALDAHARRFPSGQLGLEARLLRVEILLASGRDGDALALLDHMAIAGVPRARELRTVRGELRIKLGRCADGKADLKAVLAAGSTDPLAQRARQAIAACP